MQDLIHWSLKHDAKIATGLNRIEKFFDKQKITGVSLTEVSSKRWRDALKQFAQENGLLLNQVSNGVAGTAECAFLYDPRVWAHKQPLRVIRLSKRPSVFSKQDHYMLANSLRHIPSGQTYMHNVLHMPSGVEADIRNATINSVQVENYRFAKNTIERVARTNRNDYNFINFIGDYNLDMKKEWVRAYLLRGLPGFEVRYPRTATHGSRTIDGCITNYRPRALAKSAGYDHRPFAL